MGFLYRIVYTSPNYNHAQKHEMDWAAPTDMEPHRVREIFEEMFPGAAIHQFRKVAV